MYYIWNNVYKVLLNYNSKVRYSVYIVVIICMYVIKVNEWVFLRYIYMYFYIDLYLFRRKRLNSLV